MYSSLEKYSLNYKFYTINAYANLFVEIHNALNNLAFLFLIATFMDLLISMVHVFAPERTH